MLRQPERGEERFERGVPLVFLYPCLLMRNDTAKIMIEFTADILQVCHLL